MDTRVIGKRLRIGITLAGVFAAFVLWLGCDNTSEGDRCNPALSHDECSGDPTIQCVQVNASGSPLPDGGPAPCNGEAYCCAVDSNNLPTSPEANCQALRACALALAGASVPEMADGGSPDTGAPDSGSPDADSADAGAPYAASHDGGVDAGVPDASAADGGSLDAADASGG